MHLRMKAGPEISAWKNNICTTSSQNVFGIHTKPLAQGTDRSLTPMVV